VLSKFKNQLDLEKLLKYILNETKISKGMKSSEVNTLVFGRMMALSACVEAKVFQSGSGA
jgi:hypothetical protein